MVSDDQSNETTTLLDLYRTMVTIRTFEEVVADLVEAGEVHTPCHFCIGQEAVPAGVCATLEDDDYIWGANRSTGHYLAKGGDLQGLFSEIFCRESGCSGGRGGSMHACDPSVGMMGSVPIVAATIPLAVGAGFASQLRNSRQVSVSFFGDGATEEGHFHESLNLAAVSKLPVIFVCENNYYASHMGTFERRAKDAIPAFGESHGIPSLRLDGNEVLGVQRASAEAVARARDGGGPTLLEFQTFRWRGHVGPAWDMDVGVKRKDELKDWIKRDPIQRCSQLLQNNQTPLETLETIKQEVKANIETAADRARNSPPPAVGTLVNHVYHAA